MLGIFVFGDPFFFPPCLVGAASERVWLGTKIVQVTEYKCFQERVPPGTRSLLRTNTRFKGQVRDRMPGNLEETDRGSGLVNKRYRQAIDRQLCRNRRHQKRSQILRKER